MEEKKNTNLKISHSIRAIVKVFCACEIRIWINSIFPIPDN
jgi:hypothetical protein